MTYDPALRSREALAALLPDVRERHLLILGRTGCEPCKRLIRALASELEPDLLARVKVSIYEPGDSGTRSLHLRLGARSYPCTVLVSDDGLEGVVEGYQEQEDRPVIEDQLAFLRTGSVQDMARSRAAALVA